MKGEIIMKKKYESSIFEIVELEIDDIMTGSFDIGDEDDDDGWSDMWA